MGAIRRHLRLWAATAALVQCALLAALLPRECCAAHRPAAGNSREHCVDAAPGAHCPMRGPDGQPCPMHRAPAPSDDRHGHDGQPAEPGGCSMYGTCSGPLAAVAALLSNCGPMPSAVTVPADDGDEAHVLAPFANIPSPSLSPDIPPPRA